jgi:hypothetical protein
MNIIFLGPFLGVALQLEKHLERLPTQHPTPLSKHVWN